MGVRKVESDYVFDNSAEVYDFFCASEYKIDKYRRVMLRGSGRNSTFPLGYLVGERTVIIANDKIPEIEERTKKLKSFLDSLI